MKLKERTTELRGTSQKDLEKVLHERTSELQELRFKVSQNQFKNVRTIRVIKKEIARINTLLRMSSPVPDEVKK